MGQRWTAPGGWDVEVITLNGRQIFRVRCWGCLIVYARSVEDLVRVLDVNGVDPADLVEVQE